MQVETLARSLVDIRPLKVLATQKLAEVSILRRVLLSELDSMPTSDFLAKTSTWLAILREETAP